MSGATKSVSRNSSPTGGAKPNTPTVNAGTVPTPAPGTTVALSVLAPDTDLQPTGPGQVALQGACSSSLGTVNVVYGVGISGPASASCSGNAFAVSATIAGVPGARTVTLSQAGAPAPITRTLNYTTGAQVWARSLGTGQITGSIHGDALGNVYFGGQGNAGFGTGNGFLAKFDGNGTVLWGRPLTFVVWALDVGPDGFIYMTGPASGSPIGSDGLGYTVAKYDAQGTMIWSRNFFVLGGANPSWNMRDIAADKNGNVYVGGSVHQQVAGTGIPEPAFLQKIDATGAQVWVKQSTVTGNVNKVKVDATGMLYIFGDVRNYPGAAATGTGNISVAKVDPVTGNALWNILTGPGVTGNIANAYTAAVSPDGQSLYVAGSVSGAYEKASAGSSDAFLLKLNGLGAMVWVRQFGSVAADLVRGIAMNVAGDVYIGGTTTGNIDATNIGAYDQFVRMYSPAGALIWGKQAGTVNNDNAAYLECLAVDTAGAVYFAQDTAMFVSKYQ